MNILKKLTVIINISISLFACLSCDNTNVAYNIYDTYDINNAYIAKFLNDEEFAVSFVFDDNNLAHYEKGFPIFNKYKIPATFNVSPGYSDFPTVYMPGYLKLQEIGCEIGAHGYYHINLTTLPSTEIELHMCTKPIELITNYFGKRPISVSLNNAQANQQVEDLFKKYYFVSKHVSLTKIQRASVAWLSSMNVNNDFILHLLEDKKNKQWFIVALHGIDEEGWNPISSSQLEEMCKYCVENNIKVGTSGEIGLYEYLYANTSLKIVNISETYAEIIPVLPENFNYPSGYDKTVTVVIPVVGGMKEKCNFDFNKNTRIRISNGGIAVE